MNFLKLKYVFLSATLFVGCVPYQKDSEGDGAPPSQPPPRIEPASGAGPDGGESGTTDGSELESPVKQPSQPPADTEESRTAQSAIAKLGGTEDEVVAATRLLESMGPAVTRYLVVALKDPSPEVRQRVSFMLLARFNPANSQMTAAMIETLRDKNPEVRNMGLRAIDQIEDPTIAAPAVGHLVKMLEQEEKALVRAHAARVLGRLGEHSKPGFSVLLRAILEDQDRAVRFAALKAICQVQGGTAETVAALVAVLNKSEDANLRRQVILRLTAYGTEADSAIEPLAAILNDSNERLREAASDALGQFGRPAIEPLLRALDANQPRTRVLAALTLGKIGPEATDAVDRLKLALKDDQEAVRQAANVALRKIKPTP